MANDELREIFNETMESVISEWLEEGLSEKEISEKLTEEKIKDTMLAIMDKSSEDSLSFFKEHMYEIAYTEQAKTDEFVSRQRQTWGAGLAASQAMYIMAVESAELFSKFVAEDLDDTERRHKQYSFLVLQHMHGRACQIFLEIFHLMRLGFADGAYARWRTLYELCCCADFIRHQGEKIAKQYYEQSNTNDQNYSWAKGALDEKGNKLDAGSFKKIQEIVNIDSGWLSQYKLACFITHASSQGTFGRLANGSTENLIPVGHSNYGIATAAEHSAICLCWITGEFVTLFHHLDSDARCKLLSEWIKVVRDAYFTAHEETFGEKLGENESSKTS